ncbi:AIG2 family protein [Oleiphilus messinensis]|uniref:AIG2 family protein n=1 Tax=Oleiphilus messinensis TaxID=141451 RepID=A0A1Y0I862_9GAMM|nr:gamma-glutamylcyclotransferase family protein [Oleiphilus messinensis]ARU56697.1 AIG2 family protein [Oleiphilus messinensis]
MINYFAYGSNLPLARISNRLPGVRKLCNAVIKGYDLRFHKVGHDDSAKCDAYFTGFQNDCVYGVVYQITTEQKSVLDGIEGVGHGYDCKWLNPETEIRVESPLLIYLATRIEHDLLPWDWYVEHVLIGARQAKFPPFYIERILGEPCKTDNDLWRAEQERCIHKRALSE